MKIKSLLFTLSLLIISCVSTKSTIMNIDDKAEIPKSLGDAFVLTETAPDAKFAFTNTYPVNLGFYKSETSNQANVKKFFNAITGPNGEKLIYKKIETCCPYPTKNNSVGVGTLDIYEVTFEGNSQKFTFYINTNDKGKIYIPKGFKAKSK